MTLKYSILSVMLAVPLVQLYAQEIKIGNYTFKDGAEYQGELFKGKPYEKVLPISRMETITKENM